MALSEFFDAGSETLESYTNFPFPQNSKVAKRNLVDAIEIVKTHARETQVPPTSLPVVVGALLSPVLVGTVGARQYLLAPASVC